MAKFGFNQLDNGQPNRIKCLGFGNWGKYDPFFSQTRERQRALLRFFFLVFFDSSFSSSIPLPCVRFFILFFVLLRFSFDSFDSPSIFEAIYGQKQAFVVVGRLITGIEAKLKVENGLSVIGEALEKIRDSVKFVKGSESREKIACVETVGIQNKNNANLILDVATRWNSTFLMLSRAIDFKDALRNLSEVEPSYK
ncbi:unnamed protein product, partial [Brassica rapa]